tara:strand:- start:330 stop:1160 length:831 start_codon:yes stop_codon:yes gene_type:complete
VKSKFSLIQLNTGTNPEESCSILKDQIFQASESGAEFISTPETTNIMELRNNELFKNITLEDDDEYLEQIKEVTKKRNIWLLLGSWVVLNKNGKASNRSLLIDNTGVIRYRYNKIHLFDVDLPSGEKYRESKTYESGKEAIVGATPFGNIGFSICYDLRFPYLYRDLAQSGADIIFVPSAFTFETGKVHWHNLLCSRAIETGSYIVAPAQYGKHENGRETYGHSLVINPWGEIIAQKEEGVGFINFDINLDEVKQARIKIPAIHKDSKYSISSEES